MSNEDSGNGEIVSHSVLKKVLILKSPALKDGNKCRVHDGEYPFLAAVEDEAFLAKVIAGERFGKDDVLVVDLRQTQIVEAGTLKTEYAIVKVHEHRASLQQALL